MSKIRIGSFIEQVRDTDVCAGTIFISINPDFRNNYGHFREYERNLKEAITGAGGEYWCLASDKYAEGAHDSAEDNLNLFLVPCFSLDSGFYALSNFAGRKDIEYTISLFIRELSSGIEYILSKCESKTRIVLFFYCGSTKFAAELSTRFGIFPFPITINAFWDFLDVDRLCAPENLVALKFSRNVRLLLCSDLHSEYVERSTGLRFPSIPNPCPSLSDHEAVQVLVNSFIPKGTSARGQHIRVAMTPLPSSGKGGELVARWASEVSKSIADRFRFVVRDADGEINKQAYVQNGLEDALEFIPKSVSREQFHSIFRSVDFVILPYKSSVFGFRTSGQLVEALYFGAIPVVCSNTWLAHVCRKFGVGVIVDDFDSMNLNTLCAVMEKNIDNMSSDRFYGVYEYFLGNKWSRLIYEVIKCHHNASLYGGIDMQLKAFDSLQHSMTTYREADKFDTGKTGIGNSGGPDMPVIKDKDRELEGSLIAPQEALRRPWYAIFGDAVRRHAPGLFPVLQRVRRALWRAAGAAPVWLAGAGALAALAFIAFGPGPDAARLWLAALAAGAALVLALAAFAWRLRAHILTLSAENRRLDAEIARIHELAGGREGRVERLLDDQRRLDQHLSRLDGAQAQSVRALEERIAALKGEIVQTGQAVRSGAETALRAEIASLEARLGEASSVKVAALREELARAQAMLEQKLKARAASTSASFGRAAQAAKRREAELEARIEALDAQLKEAEQAHSANAESLAATLRSELEAAEARLREADGAGEQALRDEVEALRARLEEATSEAVSSLRSELEAAEARLREADGAGEQALRDEIKALRQGLEQRMHAEIEEYGQEATNLLAQRLGELEQLANTGDAALRAELKALRQELAQSMRAEVDDYAKALTSGLIARLDAVEAAQAEGDETYKTGLSVLKKALDDELRPEVGAVREVAESARSTAIEIKQVVHAGKAETGRLRERVEAGERQIGILRYPDAPDVFVFFGHHKCASRFFRLEVFSRIAESTGARTRRYEIKDPPFHYSRMDELDLVNIDFRDLGKDGRDVVWFANASQRSLNKIKRNAKNWKGLRIIRDPRQVLISNYFHHKGDHPDVAEVGWVWDQLVKDKPVLRELPEEDGILHELDNISKQVIEDQVLATFDDERVMTVRLEAFSEDPRRHLLQISEFLKVPDVAGIDFNNTKANPDSAPWRKHFTSRIREVFKERYGQALIDLGYAEDMDW